MAAINPTKSSTRTRRSSFPYASKIADILTGLATNDWISYLTGLNNDIVRTMSSYDALSAGTVTLVAGVKFVPAVGTPSKNIVTATSVIRLTAQNVSGTAGFLSVSIQPDPLVANWGFTITSSNLADTRKIFYEILEAF